MDVTQISIEASSVSQPPSMGVSTATAQNVKIRFHERALTLGCELLTEFGYL